MVNCLQCGAAPPARGRFCGRCGAPVSASADSPTDGSLVESRGLPWVAVAAFAAALTIAGALTFVVMNRSESSAEPPAEVAPASADGASVTSSEAAEVPETTVTVDASSVKPSPGSTTVPDGTPASSTSATPTPVTAPTQPSTSVQASATPTTRVIAAAPGATTTVATTAPPPVVTGTVEGTCTFSGADCYLTERAGPTSDAEDIERHDEGSTVLVRCQVRGNRVSARSGLASDVWAVTASGNYVSNLFLAAPGFDRFNVTVPCG